ncbi:MAG: FHA domain-containing protein [Victivallales bacterium]|nr:FHA domain-containing protein [Victivallales bacterium]
MSNIKITILSDKMHGTSYVLTNDSYTVGRSDTADICIPEPTISGHHCTFIKDEDGNYFLKDEGSTNGTRINGEKLEETDDPVKLNNGDLLQFGNIEVLFENTEAHKSESRTMTVINLDDTGDVSHTSNLKSLGIKNSPKRSQTLRDNRMHNALFKVIIILLILAILVAGVYVGLQIFK